MPKNISIILILAAACIILFYPVLSIDFFCWDDKNVALAPLLRHLSFKEISALFSSFQVGLYHPITSLSFMLDWFAGNGDPFPFHLTNLMLHLANTLLLFVIIKRLSANVLLAFLTAILFAVHPIHVESVAWVSARKDLLYSFFFLLSMLFYVDYSEKQHKKAYYILLILCSTLALLSKIQAVSLPFVFLLIDFYKGKSMNIRLVLGKLPFFLLCLIFGLVNILAQKNYGYIDYGFHFSFPEKIILFVYSVSQYFVKTIFPFPLSVFYPFPFKPGETIPLTVFIPLIIFIAGSVLLFFSKMKNKKSILFGYLFFLFNCFIVASITFNRDTVIADRYAYMSSVGILFIAAVLATEFLNNYKKYAFFMGGALGIIILGFSVLTFQRIVLWKEPIQLFSDALKHYPNSEIILNTLGAKEIEAGMYYESIAHLDKAIAVAPTYSEAYFNRGIARTKTGDFDKSVLDFSSAIRFNPVYDEAFFARGSAYMKMNNLTNAFDDFSSTIRLNRTHFGAYQNLAIVRGNTGDYSGAIDDLNAAIAINPDFGASYYLRGIALINTGRNGCDDLNKALAFGYSDAKKALDHYCR